MHKERSGQSHDDGLTVNPSTRPVVPLQEGAKVEEQIVDESDAVGLMQLQCSQARDDVAALIFPTTEDLSLVEQVKNETSCRTSQNRYPTRNGHEPQSVNGNETKKAPRSR